MRLSAEAFAEGVEFARGLPDPEVMREWPPGARVRARPGVVLLVPAPGVLAKIRSYLARDGKITGLGVQGPITIPHPVYGWGDATPGEVVNAEVDLEQVVLVDRGPLGADDLDRIIAEAKRA